MTPILMVSCAMALPAQARPRPSATAAAILAVMRTSSLLSPRVSVPAALWPQEVTHSPCLKPIGMRTPWLTSAGVGDRFGARTGAASGGARVELGRSDMTRKSLDALLLEIDEYGGIAAEFADRGLYLSGGAERVHQLARRAAGVAGERGAVRPVAPHGGADDRGAGCVRDAAVAGAEQLREFSGEPGEALRALRAFGACDRRRDPVPAGGGAVPDRGAGADDQLGRSSTARPAAGTCGWTGTTARRRGRGQRLWCGGAIATRYRGRTRRSCWRS